MSRNKKIGIIVAVVVFLGLIALIIGILYSQGVFSTATAVTDVKEEEKKDEKKDEKDPGYKATITNTPYVAKTANDNSSPFNSGTSIPGPHGSKLTMREDGILELTDSEGTSIWKSVATTGNTGAPYYFLVQRDGNLCIYNKDKKYYWCNFTSVKSTDTTPYTLRFNSDTTGAVWLELIDKEEVIMWSSKT